ncbi:MAG: T9SS type A sorting domain-containing protein [Bacteroidota bacterium]
MRALLLVLLIATLTFQSHAQNLISNSDFESGGQPRCDGWYNDCEHEITYMCNSVLDSTCGSGNVWVGLYQDAAPGGGQWCMRLTDAGGNWVSGIHTTFIGQFWGVCETKVWFRSNAYGAHGQAILYFKKGDFYTGMGGGSALGANPLNWTQFTFTDTIHSLSDTIIIKLSGIQSSPSLPGYIAYADLPEFRMIESWTDIKDTKRNNEVSSFPNPVSTQFTLSLADNEQTTISLYNFLGQQVLQQTVTNSTTINTEQLADGIYLYELRDNKGTIKTGKIVKQ